MGDYLDNMFDDWLSGHHDHEWMDEEFGHVIDFRVGQSPVVCRNCGKRELMWKKVKGAWTLMDDGQPHVCDFVNDLTTMDDVDVRLSELPLPDQCLVHRVLYYVLAAPRLDDREYDMLERDALAWLDAQAAVGSDCHPLCYPGSDLESSYPPEIVALAYEIAFPELR